MELRPATEDDLLFILALEERPDVAPYILAWPPEMHLAALDDPNRQILVLLADSGAAIGFAVLSGLASPHGSIELTRLVVADPGRGHGRAALDALIRLAFEEEGANRLWLDVFADNERARRLYTAAGFQQEGVLRQAIRRDDGFRDLVVMALIASDRAAAPRR